MNVTKEMALFAAKQQKEDTVIWFNNRRDGWVWEFACKREWLGYRTDEKGKVQERSVNIIAVRK